MSGFHHCASPVAPSSAPSSASVAPRRAYSLVEVLVSLAIIMVVASLAVAAVSSTGKKLRTRAVISKIDSIIAEQYASYAGRNVDGVDRGAMLRDIARGDLPDNWSTVAALAGKPEAGLTPHQRTYVAIWNSLGTRTGLVDDLHGSAECLFMTVMHGGLADCLDCDSLRIDVGDKDEDGMPEFLDGWGSPIGFVEQPSKLQLPPGSGRNFFSAVLPFDPVTVSSLEAEGGVMRPLIVSAGPDQEFGLEPDAAPTPASFASRDNLTNFDEEARK